MERERFASQATRDRALAAGPHSLLYARGIVEHPDELLPLPAEDVQQRIHVQQRDGSWTNEVFNGTVPDALMSDEYDLYTDGSCSTAALAERRRAGWAVVWADFEGTEVGRLSGVVPRGLPQTPQAAVYLAVLAAGEVAQLGHEVFCDCLGVVRHFAQRAGVPQLSAKLRYSGIVRLARCEAGWKQVSSMTKVPAHVELGAGLSAEERRKARGNAAADEAAKSAVARQPLGSEDLRTEWDQIWMDAIVTAQLIAAVARRWSAGCPAAGRPRQGLLRPRSVSRQGRPNAKFWRVNAANWASHHRAAGRRPSRCNFCKVLATHRQAAEKQPCPRKLVPWAVEVLHECETGASGHQLLIGTLNGRATHRAFS